MVLEVFNATNWTAVHWTIYSIIIGIMVGFIGNMLATSIIQVWKEESEKTGIPINWKRETKKWLIAFVVIIALLGLLMLIWPYNV